MKNKQKSDKLAAYEEKYKRFLTSYKTIKTSLKSIVKHKWSIVKINEVVINVNKIIIHTYQFLKLYCLDKYTNNETMPVIDQRLVNTIMKIICVNKNPRPWKTDIRKCHGLLRFKSVQ